ncbi:MAG: MBL fold metallo-hydrolase [Spirochaetia bacterium]|jgi:glyoxylase-like metal-dependent hydrolase (beta-lactamase superfamily II)|nr:MBL fold metallo-hydrolase [Spirochaetia bacterium]
MTVFFHYAVHGFANVYLVGNDQSHEAAIVDPAAFTLGLLDFIEEKGYVVTSALITHNHAHHVDGLWTLLRIYDAVVYSSNASIDGIQCRMVRDGEEFSVCGLDVQALSVPGHSADSMVYRFDKILFTGDVLHAGLIGKTMSQYGNRLLKDQLNKKILSLSDDCLVLPGHGPPTSIGAEKLYNLGWKMTKTEARRNSYSFDT